MEARVMKLLLLMAVVASASAAAAPGCCAPGQWQAKFLKLYTITTGDSVVEMSKTEILSTFDVANQRKVEMMNETTASGTTRTIKLRNYKTGKGFLYNVDTNQCRSVPTDLQFKKSCIKSTSVVTKTKVWKKLGDRNVLATTAMYQYQSNSTAFYELYVVKSDDCFPIVRTVMYTQAKNVLLWHTTALDMTKSIPSNDVFNVPAACKSIMFL